jgi:hypothetical protein
MLFYRAALPLSRSTLDYLAGVVRRHRRKIGSCWRKLNPGQQALLVLVHLRKGETFAGLAAGFGVGTTTAWRYVQETVILLAARAPRLDAALEAAKKRPAFRRDSPPEPVQARERKIRLRPYSPAPAWRWRPDRCWRPRPNARPDRGGEQPSSRS